MNPVAFALRRPLTIMVAIVGLLLGSGLAILRLPVDIFPDLNLPVIYVCQPYGGMDASQLEGLVTNHYEAHFLHITGIEHVESKNVQNMALMKLFFHPGTEMSQAMAETIGQVTRSQAYMPPGTVAPFVTRFDAGSIPVGYLVLSSATKGVGEIQDQALVKVRPMFASLPGVTAPPPFGGSQRTVVVRLDPDRLKSYGITPDEVLRALNEGNVVSPSGNLRIGETMSIVSSNALARTIEEFEDIPVRPGRNPSVYLRDLGEVQDSSDIPAGYALVNGQRAVYILVSKTADASTLSVVRSVKAALPGMQAVLPDDIHVSFEFDQSPTVTGAMSSLVKEGILGAGLVGLMILIFLRDWRSALIVILNIPLALAGALVALWLTGQTINLMTMSGLSLAIGILVDEATVEIENIQSKLADTSSVALAVRMGNLDTAVPRLLAMLCVLAVFLPSFFMTGAARALFAPMSLSVGFAMVSSYLLSSTFVPVLSVWLLRPHQQTARDGPGHLPFSGLLEGYAAVATGLVRLRWVIVPAYLIAAGYVISTFGWTLGREIFPRVDVGRFQLRIKAPTGTRIERTEQIVRQTLEQISREVGEDQIAISVGYAGNLPSTYALNAIYQWTGGPGEALLRVALKETCHVPIEDLKIRLREVLSRRMPEVRFSFEPADIVSDVMSFGAPSPVEVAISGPDFDDTRAFAAKIASELERVPALRDLQYGQALDYPTVRVDFDRQRAGLSGISAAEMARSLVTATSSSRFVLPNFWPDPKTGMGYQVQVEIPYTIMDSIEQVEAIPIKESRGRTALLRDVASLRADTMAGEYDRYNLRRTLTLSANIVGSDLGHVSSQVHRAIKRAGEPPRGVQVAVRGQIVPMEEILSGLSVGLAVAIVVILLLLMANFQSIRLAIVVVSTVPAALAGVVLALSAGGATLNIQSFIGAIMAIGVGVSNAILLITFAERERMGGRESTDAAVIGARYRLRPIVMTTCAMIVGMVPLALALGEGGQQSAPLGIAVIGGLGAATLATLLVLPAVFALVQRRAGRLSVSLDPFDLTSTHYVCSQERDHAAAV